MERLRDGHFMTRTHQHTTQRERVTESGERRRGEPQRRNGEGSGRMGQRVGMEGGGGGGVRRTTWNAPVSHCAGSAETVQEIFF